MQQPALSLVIPTRNRPTKASALVRALANQSEEFRGRCQIVISDNGDSSPLVSADIGPLLHRFHSSKVLETGGRFASMEEHVAWLAKEADGLYTWFIGDNDVPIAAGVDRVLRELEASPVPKAYLFNSNIQTQSGVRVPTRGALGSLDWDASSGVSAIRRCGVTHVGAGISCWVVPTAAWQGSEMPGLQAQGLPIYSHVMGLIAQLRSTETKYVAQPLVTYTIEDYVIQATDSWGDFARKTNRSRYQVWHLDLLRQFDSLISLGVLTWRDVGAVMDGGDGFAVRTPLTVLMLDALVRDLETVAERTRQRSVLQERIISRQDWIYALDRLWECDPRLAPVLNQLEPPLTLTPSVLRSWASDSRASLTSLCSEGPAAFWITRSAEGVFASDGLDLWQFPSDASSQFIAEVMGRVNRSPHDGDRWVEWSELDTNVPKSRVQTSQLVMNDQGKAPRDVSAAPRAADLLGVKEVEQLKSVLSLTRWAYKKLPTRLRKRLLRIT
jgi:hypothetical protein